MVKLNERIIKKVYSSCVNVDELKKDTGFAPKIFSKKGVTKIIDWFKKMRNSNNSSFK